MAEIADAYDSDLLSDIRVQWLIFVILNIPGAAYIAFNEPTDMIKGFNRYPDIIDKVSII